MRLGGPVVFNNPEEWVKEHKRFGYTAATCPEHLTLDSSDEMEHYRRAAATADLMISETGAWCNPLSFNADIRKSAIAYCQQQLALADEIGAQCCLNISGSRGEKWDGPDPENFTNETFQLVVDSVREIIDAVKPKRTFYTLETMPWIYPSTAEEYLALIQAIDRPGFGVHLDPVNMVNNPKVYFNTTDLLTECFTKLGPYIKSCHAKDIALSNELTIHLNEVRPGLGILDYHHFLRLIYSQKRDIPLMLEHLGSAEEYQLAAKYILAIDQQFFV